MARGGTTPGTTAWWVVSLAVALVLTAALFGGRAAVAQGGALPADVAAAIEAAVQSGDAAAANAALGAAIARRAVPGIIVERARTQVVEAALVSAVVAGIARYPGSVSAIVSAAVARAPERRAVIAQGASVAFPAFAGAISRAANVAPGISRVARAAPPPSAFAPLAPAPPVYRPPARPTAMPARDLAPLTAPTPEKGRTMARGGPPQRSASGETYVDGIYALSTDYWLGYPKNAWRIVSGPMNYDRDDWIKVAILAGITGSLILVDEAIMDFWQDDVRGDGSDDLAGFFELFGQEEMVYGLLSWYALTEALDMRRGKATALMALESFVLSGLLVAGMKWIVGRERPDDRDAYAFKGLGGAGTNASFPSGHTVVAFSVASVVSEMYGDDMPWASWLAYTVATGAALARINTEDHWASDVFAAAAIGYFVGKLVTRFNPFLERHNVSVAPLAGSDTPGVALAFRF